MRLLPLIPLALMAGCSSDANHIGNPLLLPINGLTTLFENAAYDERRGKVEVLVKSNWPAIVAEIDAGGGPTLTKAMEAARIPASDHPARITQLQGDRAIYANNPGALVVSLMVYGDN